MHICFQKVFTITRRVHVTVGYSCTCTHARTDTRTGLTLNNANIYLTTTKYIYCFIHTIVSSNRVMLYSFGWLSSFLGGFIFLFHESNFLFLFLLLIYIFLQTHTLQKENFSIFCNIYRII